MRTNVEDGVYRGTDPCDPASRRWLLVRLGRRKLHIRYPWTRRFELEDKRPTWFGPSCFCKIHLWPASSRLLTRCQMKAIVAEWRLPVHLIGRCRGDGCGSALGSWFDGAVHGSFPEVVVIVMGRWRGRPEKQTKQRRGNFNPLPDIDSSSLLQPFWGHGEAGRSTSGWVPSSSQGPIWAFVGSVACSREPRQYSEGVQVTRPTSRVPCMFWLLWGSNPLLRLG